MAATSSSSKIAERFVAKLSSDYPDFSFRVGKRDHWSPGSKTVFYNPDRELSELQFSLLHELSHGLLGHQDYKSDFELLKLESQAWELAAQLASKYGPVISDEHIQNCLDTYRDWLHRRSACPTCGVHVIQKDSTSYKCFNCRTEWSVTNRRFARSYRKSFNKKRPA